MKQESLRCKRKDVGKAFKGRLELKKAKMEKNRITKEGRCKEGTNREVSKICNCKANATRSKMETKLRSGDTSRGKSGNVNVCCTSVSMSIRLDRTQHYVSCDSMKDAEGGSKIQIICTYYQA